MRDLPPIIDMVLPHPKHSAETAAILSRAPAAKRYLFDAAASSWIGTFFRENLDLVVDNLEFARTPYPVTYMEIDARAMWTAWRPDQKPDATSDTALGFLIDGNSVLILARGKESRGEVAPLAFGINRPQATSLRKLTGYDDERADLVKQAFVLGGQRIINAGERYDRYSLAPGQEISFPQLPDVWTNQQVASHYDVRHAYAGLGETTFVGTCFLGGGDPLIATIALLLLNQPADVVRTTAVPAERRIERGKVRVFRPHNVVTVDLDSRPRVLRNWTHGERASPAWHEVEGHWRNYNRQEGCEHAWEPVGPELASNGMHRRYWCPKCLQRRTRVEAFSRGDPTRGIVSKDYAVTR